MHCANVLKWLELFANDHNTNGGCSDTELNELAVMPTGLLLLSKALMTVMPVANCDIASLNCWVVIGVFMVAAL